jgi:DNA-binding CsgD family transcriptional regulator
MMGEAQGKSSGADAGLLAEGAGAMGRADWAEASRCFTQALAVNETPEAHYRLGQVLWFLNELEASLVHHRRAYALYRAQGDLTAVRIACWVALEHAAIHGDISVARGWFARAARLLKDREPSPPLGWYLVTRAAFDGTPATLEEAARGAIELGERFGEMELEVLALVLLGQAIVFQGRVSEGMALIEEAMAAVLAGELEDPTVIADCFCFMLGTCEYAGDYDLAEEWVRTAAGYLEQRTCPFVAAQCRTTYAGVLIAGGRWVEAESQLIGALRMYEAGHRGLRMNVIARLADLRVRQGALEEAEDLLAGLEDVPAAVLPLARMYLARGEAAASTALLARVLPPGPLQLADAAPAGLAIEAHLVAGSIAMAQSLAARLNDLAARAGSRVLQAEAKLWEGKVLAAADPDRAPGVLAEAALLCPYPDSPLAARIRLEQARVLATSDPATAIAHARAALAGFRRLEAPRDVDESLRLLRSLGSPTRLPSPLGKNARRLTRREEEVLALVGAGLSNPEIAERLYLSPKTVEHHVGHIFGKVGLASRAALAAYAVRSGSKIGDLPDVPVLAPSADSSRPSRPPMAR